MSFGRLWSVKDPDRTPLCMGDGCTSAGLWQQLQRHRKLGSKSNQPTSEVLQALGVSQNPRPPLVTGGTAVRSRSVPPGIVLESYHHRFYCKWTRNFVYNLAKFKWISIPSVRNVVFTHKLITCTLDHVCSIYLPLMMFSDLNCLFYQTSKVKPDVITLVCILSSFVILCLFVRFQNVVGLVVSPQRCKFGLWRRICDLTCFQCNIKRWCDMKYQIIWIPNHRPQKEAFMVSTLTFSANSKQ